MARTKIGSLTVHDKPFPVEVDGAMRFHTSVNGADVSAGSKDELQEKIRLELTRQRVQHSIPLVIEHERAYVHATLRGKNARTSQYMFTLANGSKVQIDHPTILARGERVTDEDLAELNRLRAQVDEAQGHLSQFIRKLTEDDVHLSAWQLIAEAERAAAEREAS